MKTAPAPVAVFSAGQLAEIRAIVREELAPVVARLGVLEQTEAARVQRSRIAGFRRGDAAVAAHLLPALALTIDGPFQSDFLADSRDPNLRYIVAGRSVKKIGRLLSRIEGVPFGELVLVADGKLNNRRQWIVRRVVL